MKQQEWLSSLEAAEMMRVSRTFIQDRARNGYLKSKIVHHAGKPGRGTLYVLRSDIEDRLKRPLRYRWQAESASQTHYVTQEKATEILGISYGLLRNLIEEGKLTQLTRKPVPVEERVLHHKAYFRRHEVEMLAKKRQPTEHTPEDLAYMAGLVDGEGSIGIQATPGKRWAISHTLHLTMGNTCFELIDWVQLTFGGSSSLIHRPKPSWSDFRQWQVQGESAGRLLELLLPRLISKKKQALIAIEFRRHVETYGAGKHQPLSGQESKWREERRREISDLNTRYRKGTQERWQETPPELEEEDL